MYTAAHCLRMPSLQEKKVGNVGIRVTYSKYTYRQGFLNSLPSIINNMSLTCLPFSGQELGGTGQQPIQANQV